MDENNIEMRQCSPQCNPLNIDLVLETVFKFLPVQDLENVRLVNGLWNEMAIPYLRERSVVRLDENIHFKRLPLDKFLEDFKSVPAKDILFRNYRIQTWEIDTKPRMMEFWDKYGAFIWQLEVQSGRFMEVQLIRDIMFNWIPNMTKITLKDCCFFEKGEIIIYEVPPRVTLKNAVAVPTDKNVRLNFNVKSFDFSATEKFVHLPISWEEIFIAYPNLKQLFLYNLNPAETLPILDTMTDMRKKDPSKLQIEKLNIFNGDYAATEIPNHILTNLISLKLPLTQLDIDIGAHCNEQLLSKLLDQHSKSVVSMTIYRGPLGTPIIQFPFEISFPRLRKLEMTETVADTFSFVQHMPNLNNLSLCEPPDVEPPFLPTDMFFKTDYNFPSNSLPRHLHTLRIDYECGSCGDVRKVVHWFPSVKSVKIYLDNESFRTICGEWPDLEELEVLGDKVNDEGITGMKLKRENGQEIVIRNPLCILNLKRLRIFKMKNYGLTTVLSDLSVNYGFKLMKSITYLELCSKNITKEGWRTLNEMPNLITLIPTDGRWKSECDEFRKGQF